MANDLNQCNFIGRLGSDPEIRYRPEGGAVCGFSIAVGWKTKEKEGAEWVRIVAYDRLAEICGEYLRKGSKIFVSGRFKTRKWTDKDGIERYTTEIVANELQMLDGNPAAQQGGQSTNSQPSKPQQQRPAQQAGGYQSTNQRPAAPAQQRMPMRGGYANNNAGQPMQPPAEYPDDIPF